MRSKRCRSIQQETFARDKRICDLLRTLYKLPITDQQIRIETLRSKFDAFDPRVGEIVEKLCNRYRPRIVFNMGDHPDDIGITEQINNSLSTVLSIGADYFGFIFNDPIVNSTVLSSVASCGLG